MEEGGYLYSFVMTNGGLEGVSPTERRDKLRRDESGRPVGFYLTNHERIVAKGEEVVEIGHAVTLSLSSVKIKKSGLWWASRIGAVDGKLIQGGCIHCRVVFSQHVNVLGIGIEGLWSKVTLYRLS
jgi:hypothetical protein